MDDKKGRHLKYKYLFRDDYNPVYVNGAHGGVNTRLELVINFFMERPALPNSQTFEIEGQILGKEIQEEREPKDHEYSLVRYIEAGVIMTLPQAIEIHRWMGKHIETLKRLQDNANTEEE